MEFLKFLPNTLEKRLYDSLFSFLWSVNGDFPIPLEKKTKIPDLFNKFITRADLFVAVEDNKVVGLVSGYLTNAESNSGYISVVAVNKDYRHKGIASSLLINLLAYGKQISNKLNFVHLYTSPSNFVAIKMYESLGFIKTDVKEENRINDVHLVYNFV